MKENDRFYYELDDYNRITLVSTYVEGNIVWLKQDISDEVLFKYNIATKKLYKWVSPEWITTEYELKQLDADTIWNSRVSAYYSCRFCNASTTDLHFRPIVHESDCIGLFAKYRLINP